MQFAEYDCVLMYHGVPRRAHAPYHMDAAIFESQLRYLQQHTRLIHPKEADDDLRDTRPKVLLTFDDSFHNNIDVAAPILRKYSAPAVFFACNRHSVPHRYLWFTYLQALERSFPESSLKTLGRTLDMAEGRAESMKWLRLHLLSLRPHPAAMYEAIENELPAIESFVSESELADCCEGMSSRDIAQLAGESLFVIGAHTADHPMLTRCSNSEIDHQLAASKRWVEDAAGRTCDLLAYPNGDYDERVLQCAKNHGFTRGFAVIPHAENRTWEIGRTGIYSASLFVLGCKLRFARHTPLYRWAAGLRAFAS
jgi:peptidoglycan/xylan/chitin deacetylase (PgdA/CDA1 family)